jgi:hypothetical protein
MQVVQHVGVLPVLLCSGACQVGGAESCCAWLDLPCRPTGHVPMQPLGALPPPSRGRAEVWVPGTCTWTTSTSRECDV